MALSITEAQARQTQTIAAVYLRISSDPQGLRAGVERQREDCLAECARRGWHPVIFEDNDVSAYSRKKRPQFEKMLTALQAGQVQAVVAWATDRLYRRIEDLGRVIDVVDSAGAAVATVQGGNVNLSTADGKMMARLLVTIHQGEVEKMSDRMKRQRKQAAEQGKPNPGGRRPFGFEADKITHRGDEAIAIRDAVEALINGATIRSVTRDLGFPTTVACKRMLMSPRIAGLVQAGAKLVQATWDPIVPREDWELLSQLLKAPQRHPGGVAARRYLLSGFLRCAVCDAKLQSNPTLGRQRYACPDDHVIRQAQMLEEYVVERVLSALESPAVAEALAEADKADDGDSRQLAAEVARLEAKLREIRQAWIEDLMTKQEWARDKAGLEERISEIRRVLSSRAGAKVDMPVGSERIRAAWMDGTLEDRRQLIDTVVERIVIGKAGKGARKIDPATVEIHWRFE